MQINKHLHPSSRIKKFPKFTHFFLFFVREILSRIFFYIKIKKQTKKFDGISTSHNLPFLNDKFFKCYYMTKEKVGDQNNNYEVFFRCHQLCYVLEQTRKIDGDIIELGVAKGFQFLFAKNFLGEKLDKRIFLVDTFSPFAIDTNSGLQDDPTLLNQGKNLGYAKSFENTKKNFEGFDQFHFVKGRVPQILSNINIDKISFIHMDLNYAPAEYEAYKYLWEKLSPGGMILSDDFAYVGHEDQMKKTISFFEEKNHQILTLATGQGLVIKK